MHIEDELKNKLGSYLNLTKKALDKALKAISSKKDALVVLDMANRYYNDALYFREKGMLTTALASVSYAHGWLDCGNRIGLFNVKDSKLFITK